MAGKVPPFHDSPLHRSGLYIYIGVIGRHRHTTVEGGDGGLEEGTRAKKGLGLGIPGSWQGVEIHLGCAPQPQLALSVCLPFLTFNVSFVIPGSLQFLSPLPQPERRPAGS